MTPAWSPSTVFDQYVSGKWEMSRVSRAKMATGVEERLEAIATPRGDLYSWTALPPQTDRCVLMCSSILGDFTTNYHRERQMGRALASQGWAVVRFHYAGEGNSGGNRREMTFPSLCADAAAALAYAQCLGFGKFGILGTRIGALVAAWLASTSVLSPVAMWEPVTDPLRFIKDGQRAKKISEAAQKSSGPGMSWQLELEQKGYVDLLGYDVFPPLISSFLPLDLLELLGSPPRQIFVARFGERHVASDSLAPKLSERGFSVKTGRYGAAESWFLQSEAVEDHADLISATLAWFNNAMNAPT